MEKKVYIPPYKRKKMILENEDNEQYQRNIWELLKKSINGIINKVNEENLNFIIIELINENLKVGKGLWVKSIIKAQFYSINFSYIFAALVNIIGSKLPEISELIIKRVILLFRKGYEKKDRLLLKSSLKFIAHMINQRFLNDFIGLQILALFLENYTNDSIELAIYFLKDCGLVLYENSSKGIFFIYEKLKELIHEEDINAKSQFYIEEAFLLRKNNFENKDLKVLDVLSQEDLMIHNIGIDDEVNGEYNLDNFIFYNNYEEIEKEWANIKENLIDKDYLEYLNNFNYSNAKGKNNELSEDVLDEEDNEEDDNDCKEEGDDDSDEENDGLSDEEIKILTKTIYLTIMNSIDYEECSHKLMMMKVNSRIKKEISNMIVECCWHEKSYLKFYGLLAERFCKIDEEHKQNFSNIFMEKYIIIHRIKSDEIRNLSKLYSHLIYTKSIELSVFKVMILTEEDTTASNRIFIKNLFLDLSELYGVKNLSKLIYEKSNYPNFQNIFFSSPIENVEFSINFFITIGLNILINPIKTILEENNHLEDLKEYEEKKIELEKLEKIEKENNFLEELDLIENKIRNRSYSNSEEF